MSDADDDAGPPSSDKVIHSLPEDVQQELRRTLQAEEAVSGCLIADITHGAPQKAGSRERKSRK